MSNRSVTIELERDEVELLLMALSLARNSPEIHRNYDLDTVIEAVATQMHSDTNGSNAPDEY